MTHIKRMSQYEYGINPRRPPNPPSKNEEGKILHKQITISYIINRNKARMPCTRLDTNLRPGHQPPQQTNINLIPPDMNYTNPGHIRRVPKEKAMTITPEQH